MASSEPPPARTFVRLPGAVPSGEKPSGSRTPPPDGVLAALSCSSPQTSRNRRNAPHRAPLILNQGPENRRVRRRWVDPAG